jgi:hypothetical protein
MAPAAVAAAAPILQGLAASEAPGKHPEGGVFGGQFEEGQVLEQPLNVQPGKCYTILGVSMGDISQLDLQLVMEMPPLPPMVAAQSSGQGPTATLGGKASGCWKNPTPLASPAKVILKATRGAGMAAAQVYVD